MLSKFPRADIGRKQSASSRILLHSTKPNCSKPEYMMVRKLRNRQQRMDRRSPRQATKTPCSSDAGLEQNIVTEQFCAFSTTCRDDPGRCCVNESDAPHSVPSSSYRTTVRPCVPLVRKQPGNVNARRGPERNRQSTAKPTRRSVGWTRVRQT